MSMVGLCKWQAINDLRGGRQTCCTWKPVTKFTPNYLLFRYAISSASDVTKGVWRVAKTIRSKGQVALCEALIEARIKAGLGQEELAVKLNCHQSLVARIESGQRRIDVVELVVLARALGFAPSAVLALVEAATEPDHRI